MVLLVSSLAALTILVAAGLAYADEVRQPSGATGTGEASTFLGVLLWLAAMVAAAVFTLSLHAFRQHVRETKRRLRSTRARQAFLDQVRRYVHSRRVQPPQNN